MHRWVIPRTSPGPRDDTSCAGGILADVLTDDGYVKCSPSRRHRRAACGPCSAILMRVSLSRTLALRRPSNVRNSDLEPSGRSTDGAHVDRLGQPVAKAAWGGSVRLLSSRAAARSAISRRSSCAVAASTCRSPTLYVCHIRRRSSDGEVSRTVVSNILTPLSRSVSAFVPSCHDIRSCARLAEQGDAAPDPAGDCRSLRSAAMVGAFAQHRAARSPAANSSPSRSLPTT